MYNGGDRMVTGHVDLRTTASVREIRVFTVSSMMLHKGHSTLSEHLPRPEPERGVMNILVLCGNNIQYTSRGTIPVLEYIVHKCGANVWHHVFWVPGPWEYCGDTLEKGDAYSAMLPGLAGDERKRSVILLGSQPGAVQSVLFVDFGLLITGAPCWPCPDEGDTHAYYNARRVYYRGTDYPTDNDAVGADNVPTQEVMRDRLKRDLTSITESIARCPDVPVCMVITHGCPTSLLCTDERRQGSDYYGTTEIALGKLGLLNAVDYWLIGAEVDVPVARLTTTAGGKRSDGSVKKSKAEPGRKRDTLFIANHFVARDQKLSWGNEKYICVGRTNSADESKK